MYIRRWGIHLKKILEKFMYLLWKRMMSNSKDNWLFNKAILPITKCPQIVLDYNKDYVGD
jgi:hypothetical protein